MKYANRIYTTGSQIERMTGLFWEGGMACGCNWNQALQLHPDGQINEYLNPGRLLNKLLRMQIFHS